MLSYFTDSAVLVDSGRQYRVADGALASLVRSAYGAPDMERTDVVVDDNTVISFYTYLGATYSSIIDFTSSGDVLIARHEVPPEVPQD